MLILSDMRTVLFCLISAGYLLLVGVSAHATIETTGTIPKGVYSPEFSFGVYSGLSERYNAVGLLEGVSDRYHISLTGPKLAKLNPQLSKLVNALNNYSSTEKLGNSLSLGVLDFQAAPEIDYFAPTLSYGVTNNLAVGFGIPIVHFRNEMHVVQGGECNAAEMQKYVGSGSAEVTDAFNQLVAACDDLPGTLQQTLTAKGYKPVQPVEFTSIGDIQLYSRWAYYSKAPWRLSIRPFVQLPTGRPDDPDDLGDLAIGGQPAFGIHTANEYTAFNRLTMSGILSVQVNIPDSVEKRVPNGPDDILPAADRKENVQRLTGNTLSLTGGARYQITDFLLFGTYYNYVNKDSDWYSGGHNWDYSVLSVDTASQMHMIKAYAEFSSIKWFYQKTFAVPFLFGFIYANTIQAVNAPRQISNILYLRMFF